MSNERVVFNTTHDNQESGECISRFWEEIARLAEELWTKEMNGKMEIISIDD